MQDTISETVTTIYCVCAQVLEAMGFEDDKRSRVSEAEVMLLPLVSALFHHSNHAKTRAFLKTGKFCKTVLSHSRFSRRLHGVPKAAWELVFSLLSRLFVQNNPKGDYATIPRAIMPWIRCPFWCVKTHVSPGVASFLWSKTKFCAANSPAKSVFSTDSKCI